MVIYLQKSRLYGVSVSNPDKYIPLQSIPKCWLPIQDYEKLLNVRNETKRRIQTVQMSAANIKLVYQYNCYGQWLYTSPPEA